MKNTMKIMLVAMMVVLLALCAIACNSNGSTETEAPTNKPVEATTVEEVPTEEPTETTTEVVTEVENTTEPMTETEPVTEEVTEPATEPETEVVQSNCTQWEVTGEPTCTGEGVRTRTIYYEIRVAGTNTVLDTYEEPEYEAVPPAGHQLAERNAKPATCTETGMTAEVYCTECGEIITESEVLPIDPENHGDLQILSAIEPGCITLGKTEGQYCAACGKDVVRQRDLPATGEHVLEIVPATHATCTRPGLSEGERCKFCGMWTVQQYETEKPIGHDWHWFVCSNCGEDQTSKGLKYQVIQPRDDSLYADFDDLMANYVYGFDAYDRLGDAYRGCAIVTGLGTCTDRDIIIPEYIDGRKVVTILCGNGASFDKTYNADLWDSIYIPDTVVEDRGYFGKNKATGIKAPVYVASEATYQLFATGNNAVVLTMIDFNHFE